MTAKSYTHEITVSNTPGAAYRALTSEFDRWWASSSGSLTASNTMTIRFDPTYWTMRATNLVPDECVELECIEAHHIHEGLPESILKEWEGTTLRWQIQQEGEHTKIMFTHDGLIPSLGCYDVCEAGWDHFFVNSLKSYLDNGEGNPSASKEK